MAAALGKPTKTDSTTSIGSSTSERGKDNWTKARVAVAEGSDGWEEAKKKWEAEKAEMKKKHEAALAEQVRRNDEQVRVNMEQARVQVIF